MPMSEKEMLEELRKQGITTLEELAKRAAKDAADKSEPVPEYVLTGVNYSLFHPDPPPPPPKKSPPPNKT